MALTTLDIQAGTDGRGYIRLCAGGGCYFAKRGIYKDSWTHVAVVYSSEHASIFENFISFCIMCMSVCCCLVL